MSITELQPVESSNVEAVGYDAESSTLAVRFKSGGLYHYKNVAPEAHAALMDADSIGSHIARVIRPGFDHELVDESAANDQGAA
jgi:hypothetical protein